MGNRTCRWSGDVAIMRGLWLQGKVDYFSHQCSAEVTWTQLISDSAFIDRKIKFRIPSKSNIALKFLRGQLGSLLAHQFRGKILTESQILWNDISLMVLGKIKVEDEGSEPPVILIKWQPWLALSQTRWRKMSSTNFTSPLFIVLETMGPSSPS